jgi:hypothetical protein
MWGLAVIVKMPRYLAVPAGVVAAVASKASRLGGRRCTSFKAEGAGLVGLSLMLAKLGVLPYKGPEAAMSISSNQPFPYLLLALCVLPPLVFIAESLLPSKCFEVFDVAILAVKLARPMSAIPQPDYICIHTVIS